MKELKTNYITFKVDSESREYVTLAFKPLEKINKGWMPRIAIIIRECIAPNLTMILTPRYLRGL